MALFSNNPDFWGDDESESASSQEETAEDKAVDADGADKVEQETSPPTSDAVGGTATRVLAGTTTGTGTGKNFVTGIGTGGGIEDPRLAVGRSWVIEDNSDVSHLTLADIAPDVPLTFPFELDAFQKRAIQHLERDRHTFVAAHTSAGKTVIADFAIARARHRGLKAIYTSPIKALSNQKFREFQTRFGGTGIITGDVSLNPDAQCLIMTTEILRAMLYRGDPMLADLEVVIFDEVHYVNDPERGVVWEEVIIMLPSNVTMVMLSATAPNYLWFADWIGRTKRREVFAVSTSHRPTPLMHYLWCGDKSFVLMDGESKFNTYAYNDVYRALKAKEVEKTRQLKSIATQGKGKAKAKAQQALQQGNRGAPKYKSETSKTKTEVFRLQTLIRKLETDQQLPVVVFCFSRRKCEIYATSMPKLSVVDQSEQSRIHCFVKETLSHLSDADKEVPQVAAVAQLVERGIGVHHGGLLPIIKELVEILFSRGLVKILFATETFAMGVNMPARSVVFSTIQKHDGQRFRTLLPSEYIQMAGRAGRRGIDTHGSVYIFSADEPPESQELTRMMQRKASPLESQFRLTFHMMLQLRRCLGSIEGMMARSYRESVRAKERPLLKRDLARLDKELGELPKIECLLGEPSIDEYVVNDGRAKMAAKGLNKALYLAKGSRTVFQSGRVVAVSLERYAAALCTGCILSQTRAAERPTDVPAFRVLVRLPASIQPVPKRKGIGLRKMEIAEEINIEQMEINFAVVCDGVNEQFAVYNNVSLDKLATLFNCVIQRAADHDDQSALTLLAQDIVVQVKENKNAMKPYVLEKSFNAIELDFLEFIMLQESLQKQLQKNKCHSCDLKEQHYIMSSTAKECNSEITSIKSSLGDTSLDLWDEMTNRLQVLQMRGMIDENGIITLKGQVACEITTSDEISLVESLFENVIQGLEPEEAAAVLSMFVYPEKSQDTPLGPTEGIIAAETKVRQLHDDIEKMMLAVRIRVDTQAWRRLCNNALCLVVYLWATGAPFAQIMELTTMQEGTIVRAIQRLADLVRKVKDAAMIMGDGPLADLMVRTEAKVKRDVVFAPSLYLVN